MQTVNTVNSMSSFGGQKRGLHLSNSVWTGHRTSLRQPVLTRQPICLIQKTNYIVGPRATAVGEKGI